MILKNFIKKSQYLFLSASLLASFYVFAVINEMSNFNRFFLFVQNFCCLFGIAYYLKFVAFTAKIEVSKKTITYVISFVIFLFVNLILNYYSKLVFFDGRFAILLLIEFSLLICLLELKIALTRSKKVFQEYNQFKISEVEFKLNVLREQLNPHFLFNSLNVLKSLINIDPEKAVKYTVDLADLLRITIDSDKKETSIKDELELCALYLSIQNSRFSNNIFFNVGLSPQEKQYQIPFLTLIILIENAIKHNVISTQEKLFINLSVEDDFLVLKNNLNKKHHSIIRKGMGIESINTRCKLLVNKELEILENKDYFSVKIPYKK